MRLRWMLLAVLACAVLDAAAPVRRLVLLHTSDEHSHLFGVGPEAEDFPPRLEPAPSVSLTGGLARRATVFKQLRAQARAEGAAVLTFSSGDNLMGTFAHVASETRSPDLRAMKALGYDATTFGNHDFELGPGFLGRTLQAAERQGGSVPIVASNIRFSGDPKGADALLASFLGGRGPIRRWRILTATNGLRVGVLGVLGPNAAYYSPGKRPVKFSTGPTGDESDLEDSLRGLCAELQVQVDGLRRRKVDLVVVLAHAGLDAEAPERGESYRIAREVAGIDVVLSGHTHLLAPFQPVENRRTGRRVIVTEPGHFGRFVNKVALTVDGRGRVALDPAGCLLVPVTDAAAPDPAMAEFAAEVVRDLESGGADPWARRTVAAVTGRPVPDGVPPGGLVFHPLGRTAFDVPQDGVRPVETPMLRLVADALLAQARRTDPATDASLVASGYVRAGLLKGRTGTVSLADAFRALPLGISPVDGTLGHPMALVGVRGADLKTLLEFSPSLALVKADQTDYFSVTAGLCATFDIARPVMDRVVRIVRSSPADPDRCDGPVLYDAAKGGWQSGHGADRVYRLATDWYHLAFGFPAARIPLLRPDGTPATPREVLLHRPDGSEVKSFEALATHIQTLGRIPAAYADPAPKRTLTVGGSTPH